jgi:hypothetical protein
MTFILVFTHLIAIIAGVFLTGFIDSWLVKYADIDSE